MPTPAGATAKSAESARNVEGSVPAKEGTSEGEVVEAAERPKPKRKGHRGGCKEKEKAEKDQKRSRVLDGLGLFATQLIKAGTVISSEQAVAVFTREEVENGFALSRHVRDPQESPYLRDTLAAVSYDAVFRNSGEYEPVLLNMIRALPPWLTDQVKGDQRKIRDLAHAELEYRMRWYFDCRWMSGSDGKCVNYYSGPDSALITGLFPQGSRYNHDCTPNALPYLQLSPSWQNKVNYKDPTMTSLNVRAIRDIQKDEEVTISYLYGRPGHVADYAQRAERLSREFLLICYCKTCVASWAGLRQRAQMCTMFQAVTANQTTSDAVAPPLPSGVSVVETLENLITMLRTESLLGMELAMCYASLSEEQWGHEDVKSEKVRAWVKEATQVWRNTVGTEGHENMLWVEGIKQTGYKKQKKIVV